MTTTFTLYCSEYQQNQYNKKYPIQKNISSCEDLKEAVRFDHICAACKDSERKNDNFLYADCSMFDIDNTESDNPSDWVTLETVRTAFPNVPFYVSYSRNHMKPKGNKAPRPKFHVYFPHQAVSNKENYKKLKEMACAYFKAFDQNAKDVARFFFGVEQPQVEYVEGTLSLVDFMGSVKSNDFTDSTAPRVHKEVIPEGERNTTMSRYAAKVLTRWGNSGKAYQLFIEKSKQCVPPLAEQELHSIWKSAVGFFHERVEQDPNYILPEQYPSKTVNAQYCLEVKDFLAWGKAKELRRTARKLSVEAVKLLLQAFGVQVKINDMSKIVEVSGLPEQYQNEDAFASLMTIVFDTALRLGFSYVQQNTVYNNLSLLANEKRYHPVMEILNFTEWDKKDRFPELYRMMGISDSFDKTLVHKWALQTIAVLYNTQESPVGAQGVLVLQGDQGIGKTELFRHLAIEDSFFKGGATLDMSNKDSMMSATKVWICELGEVDATTKKQQSALKAFLTEVTDRYREPYARTESVRTRRTSFCGTVNPKEYLTDPTGNRRFWTIHVEDMDLDAIFSHPKAWYTQFWKQVQEEYMKNPKGYLLTPQEQAYVMEKNHEYETLLYGEDEILTIFDTTATDFSTWKKWTASEVAVILNTNFKGLSIEATEVGKYLVPRLCKKLGVKKLKNGKKHGNKALYYPPLCPNFHCPENTNDIEDEFSSSYQIRIPFLEDETPDEPDEDVQF